MEIIDTGIVMTIIGFLATILKLLCYANLGQIDECHTEQHICCEF